MTNQITIDRAVVEQALEQVQEFKRRWWLVPAFGNKVNKATREAVTNAHAPIFQIEDTLRTALRTALAEPDVDPCIDGSCDCCWTDKESQNKAEQPAEQEPVAWSVFDKRTKKHWYTHDSKYTAQHYSNEYSHREPDGTPHNVVVPLYASPQTAKQPLTDAEIDSLWAAIPNQALYKAVRAFARAIENVILGVKNNGSV